MPRNKFTLFVILLMTGSQAFSQIRTETEVLRKAGEQQLVKERNTYERLRVMAQKKNWPLSMKSRNGGVAYLTSIDYYGNPVYVSTESNRVAAATISTNQLWSGGSLGLSLSGSSNTVKGKLGIWDGGRVRTSHVELIGRTVLKDGTTENSDHSTHVAGTMIATGVNPLAKGMAWQMQDLQVYDFNNHISEMISASPNLLVSNHSYGEIAGWNENLTLGRWEFWGPPNSNEDPRFGMYTDETQLWDSIAFNAPFYLIVKSSGNNRDENGPAVGAEYYRRNGSGDWIKGNRPASLDSNNSFDIISSYGTAKNILTVGAVNPIELGYSQNSDVVMSSFSSWGPTDDGRIKPDVVADGVNVFSSISSSNNAYSSFSGTSMASPNVSGSLILLQEYYAQLHSGAFMRSATLKGLVIHTADEAGAANGPDYKYGWGLANIAKAATLIKDDNSPAKTQIIQEQTLNNGNTYTFTVIASGKGPLVATICWTDPKAEITALNLLNSTTPKLVHDLDLRITEGANTFMPWKMDPTPANRNNAATTGDNILDNVEKIEIPNIVPGRSYTIRVTHKGTLARGLQAFSLLISGAGGTATCTSSPTNSNGARVNGVKLGSLDFTAASTSTCTQYVDNTNAVAQVETGKQYPLSLTVGTCGGENLPSIAFKLFADVNGNGIFDLPAELLYTQAPGTPGQPLTTLNANINIPAGIKPGQLIRARIVLSETADASTITSCGTYAKGETHDFMLKVVTPGIDLGVVEIVSPLNGECPNGPQYVSIRIRNTGTQAQTNVPITLKVMKGANTVLNTTGTYKGTVPAAGSVVYTIQNPFTPEAGATYTIEASTTFAADQDQSNNTKIASINIAQASPSDGSAEICNNNLVSFKGNGSTNDVYFWYDALNATKPIAAGTKSTSTVITGDKKYFVEKNYGSKIGPATNGTLSTTGVYNAFKDYFMSFTTTSPVLIESARLYVGQGSTSGKLQLILGKDLDWDEGTFTGVGSSVIDIYPTDPNPVANQGYQADDPGAVFLINLPVPAAGNYFILVRQAATDNAQLFSNTNLTTSPYPAGITSVFNFTSNVQQYINNDQQKYWFVLYDMKLRFNQCASNGRTEVTATTPVAPTITLSENILTSSVATGNQWYKNNALLPGETNNTYTIMAPGIYKTTVTSEYGCIVSSNDYNFTITSIPNVDPAAIGLKIQPNPSDGRFVADFTVTKKADLNITILNTLGQKVYENNYPGFIGRFNKTIEAANLTTGVYMLRIQHDKKSYLTKILIR